MTKEMQKIGLLLLAIIALTAALWHFLDKDEEKIAHYAGIELRDSNHALSILDAGKMRIGEVLADTPNASRLEEVHEISYSLESAVDFLRELRLTNRQETALDNMDEAVQALHYASEEHDSKATKKWFHIFSASYRKFSEIFNAPAS